MNREIWKEVPNYDGFYEVSNKGNVRSWKVRNGRSANKDVIARPLTKSLDSYGYHVCGLSKDGTTKTHKVHRLVAMAFIRNENGLPQINHLDGNKTNNNVNNLEWCSAKRNVSHSIDNGLRTPEGYQGSNNAMSLLDRNDVLDIRNAYRLGCFTHQDFADAYGVCRQHISAIINCKRWSHL